MRIRWNHGLGVGSLVALAACTPPQYEARTTDMQTSEPAPQSAVPAGASGATAGMALFASEDQMYAALADVLGGTLSRGAQAYSLDMQEQSEGFSRQAYDSLHEIATRSTKVENATDGRSVSRVLVDVRPLEGGRYRVIVRSAVIEAGGGILVQTRRAVAWIDDSGQSHMVWTAPPEY